MKYMGSKNRIAKHILPIMLKYRKPDQYWVEPFVGGGNMIDKVDGKRIGADSDENTINALISIRDNIEELPKNNSEFTESDYKKLRGDTSYKHYGYAGYGFSYSGKWLGGWCRDRENKRDYVAETYRNAVKQSPNLQGVELINSSYLDLDIPENSIIYCDPPYANTTKYKGGFDHDEFWEWVRLKVIDDHTVFVSEYNAPDDFKSIWSKEIVSSLTKDTGSKKGVEQLFVHESFIT